jgi:hypothetical protein
MMSERGAVAAKQIASMVCCMSVIIPSVIKRRT